MAQERFIATVTFYVYGDQEKAFKKAQKIAAKIEAKHDNHAAVEKLHKQAFGELGATEINIEQFKTQQNG